MNVKVILISQFELPFSKIGSWTTMYTNYLSSSNKIDFVICPKPNQEIKTVNYVFTDKSLSEKVINKLVKKPYQNYLKALEKILENDTKYIIQIIDNFGIVSPLHEFLTRNNHRQNCFIQFFYHGFDPFFGNFQSRPFFEHIDEMVLLTKSSYEEHLKYYTVLPCSFRILHNGVDTNLFHPVNPEVKHILKTKLQLENKIVFIWCSNDRPKKGLKFLINLWKKISKKHTHIHLLVVGNKLEIKHPAITSLGIILNNKLPAYYQMSDYFLFPTLCKEGFGMSLIEALHCGCYPIASALGGVPEVLEQGKFGSLIQNPNFYIDWEQAIEEVIIKKTILSEFSSQYYTLEQWCENQNKLIEETKGLIKD